MNDLKKYLAIIPARGGSKRLPRKNILPLAGKPLLAWTIDAAASCQKIDKIVVTSDDDEILSIAGDYHVNVLRRPIELASDIATSFDVIKHAIESNPDYEYMVFLQPTSPLRTSEHIHQAIELLEDKKADAVISVCETEHSPLWANTLPIDRNMQNFLRQDLLNLRSQDLPIHYRLNGAIYICKTEKMLQKASFFLNENIYAYVMDAKSSVDIDTTLDFKWAEFLLDEGQE